jgi:hypothetical protein
MTASVTGGSLQYSGTALLYSHGIGSYAAQHGVPEELRQWFEAQRVIVMDAIR